jgi:LPS-assembly lipoprotein
MAGVARRLVLTMAAAPLLAACGFRPIYAPTAAGGDSPAAKALSQISVGIIGERAGQELRQALQERLERFGIAAAPQYDLVVSTFTVNSEQISIQADTTATWVRVIGTASYTLVSDDPGRRTVTSGLARSVDGYNLYDQQYFAQNLEAEQVQRRVAEAVADQIALQLATYFNRQAAKPAAG